MASWEEDPLQLGTGGNISLFKSVTGEEGNRIWTRIWGKMHLKEGISGLLGPPEISALVFVSLGWSFNAILRNPYLTR